MVILGTPLVSYSQLLLQIHNVHHPVSVSLYYEDQKEEALRAAEQFRAVRLPKFLQHFQSVLETNPANKDGKGEGFYFLRFLKQLPMSLVLKKVPSCSQTLPRPRT